MRVQIGDLIFQLVFFDPLVSRERLQEVADGVLEGVIEAVRDSLILREDVQFDALVVEFLYEACDIAFTLAT